MGELSPTTGKFTRNIKEPWSKVISNRSYSYNQMSYLSTVNTRAILPMARILLRITSFLLIASLCSSSSSPSSSSSVQILRIFTSISVTNSKGVKNKSWMEESNSWCLYCWFPELEENLAIECWEGRLTTTFYIRTLLFKNQMHNDNIYNKFLHL